MRTKKIEKQINKIINEADQVPNYVLNQAKSYMKLNHKYEARYPVFRKFGFRIVSLVSTIILLICVVAPIIIIDTDTKEEPKFGNSEELDTIVDSSLAKEEISSIAQYNIDHQTNYFNFKNLEIESSYLFTSSSEKDFLMLEEHYFYEDGKIHIYLHNVKYSIKDDNNYLLYQKQDFVKNISILSSVEDEHTTRIFFRIDEIGYFITMEDIEDYRPLLVEMLQG